MQRSGVFLCLLLCLAIPAAAQDSGKLEVGTYLGFSFTFDDGETLTSFSLPGAGTLFGLAALYMTVFSTSHVLVEPQLHLQTLSNDGETESVLSGILQIGYLATPMQSGSFYVAVQGGGLHIDLGRSNGVGVAGLGMGYRWRVGPGGAVRLEARYRRWIDEGNDLNELAFALGVGGVFR